MASFHRPFPHAWTEVESKEEWAEPIPDLGPSSMACHVTH